MKKARNAEDSTLRNVKASTRRDNALSMRLRRLHELLVEQEARIDRLEDFAKTIDRREWLKVRR